MCRGLFASCLLLACPVGAVTVVKKQGAPLVRTNVAEVTSCKNPVFLTSTNLVTLESPFDRARPEIKALRSTYGVLTFVCDLVRSVRQVAPGYKMVVFHDRLPQNGELDPGTCELSKGEAANIDYQYFNVTQLASQLGGSRPHPQDIRFVGILEYLEREPSIDCVLMTDGRDVVLQESPDDLLRELLRRDELLLEVGDKQRLWLGTARALKRRDASLMSEGSVSAAFEAWRNALTGKEGDTNALLQGQGDVGCGMVAGSRARVLDLLRGLSGVIQSYENDANPVDWPACNYVADAMLRPHGKLAPEELHVRYKEVLQH